MSMSQRSFTISTKLDVLRRIRLDFDGNLSKASRELNIDRKRLREWQRQEPEFANATNKQTRRAMGGGKKPFAPELEVQLFAWFKSERQTHKRVVNYAKIRTKAAELRVEMNIPEADLKLSDKWIYNFCKRHQITSRYVIYNCIKW